MPRTSNANPAGRLKYDMAKYKAQRDAAIRERDDLRVKVIALILRDRLARFDYFTMFIGIDKVIGSDGCLDIRLLDREVSDLLTRMPELAAPSAK
jgi:hypothetical protein